MNEELIRELQEKFSHSTQMEIVYRDERDLLSRENERLSREVLSLRETMVQLQEAYRALKADRDWWS